MKIFMFFLLLIISVVAISSCRIYSYVVFVNPDFSNVESTNLQTKKYLINGVSVEPRIIFSDGTQKYYELFFLLLSKNGKEKMRVLSYCVSMEGQVLSEERQFNVFSDPWEYFEENDGFFSSAVQGKKIDKIDSDTIKKDSRIDVTFVIQVIGEDDKVKEKEISTYFIAKKKYFFE